MKKGIAFRLDILSIILVSIIQKLIFLVKIIIFLMGRLTGDQSICWQRIGHVGKTGRTGREDGGIDIK